MPALTRASLRRTFSLGRFVASSSGSSFLPPPAARVDVASAPHHYVLLLLARCQVRLAVASALLEIELRDAGGPPKAR